MLAELNKHGFQYNASSPIFRQAELKHSVVGKAVDQWCRRLRTRVHDKEQNSTLNICLIESLLFRAEF